MTSGSVHEQQPAKPTGTRGRRNLAVALFGSATTLLAALSWIVLSSMASHKTTGTSELPDRMDFALPQGGTTILIGNDSKCKYYVQLVWRAGTCSSPSGGTGYSCVLPGTLGTGTVTVTVPVATPILSRAYVYPFLNGGCIGTAAMSWDCVSGPSGSVGCTTYPPPTSNTFRLNGSQGTGGLRICSVSNGC